MRLDDVSVQVTGELPESYERRLLQIRLRALAKSEEHRLIRLTMPNGTVMHFDPHMSSYQSRYKFETDNFITTLSKKRGGWTAEFRSGLCEPDGRFAAAIQEKVGTACKALFPRGYELTPGHCSVSLHYRDHPSWREIDNQDVCTRAVRRAYLGQAGEVVGRFYGVEGADIQVKLFEPIALSRTSNARNPHSGIEAEADSPLRIVRLRFGSSLVRQVAQTRAGAEQGYGLDVGLDIPSLLSSLVRIARWDGSYPAFFRVSSEEHRSLKACIRPNHPAWEGLREAFLGQFRG